MTAPDTVHLFGPRHRSDAETVRLAVEALREVAPVMADATVERFQAAYARRLAEEGTPNPPPRAWMQERSGMWELRVAASGGAVALAVAWVEDTGVGYQWRAMVHPGRIDVGEVRGPYGNAGLELAKQRAERALNGAGA